MSAIFTTQTQVKGDVMAFKDALVKQEGQELKECAARDKAAQKAAEEMRLKEQAKHEEEKCAKCEEEECAKCEEEERAKHVEEECAKHEEEECAKREEEEHARKAKMARGQSGMEMAERARMNKHPMGR
jgi:hypothetical protein